MNRINHLGNVFYCIPDFANQTMTLRQWQETALYTEGWITACGYIYDLVGKRLASGVYRVTTQRRY